MLGKGQTYLCTFVLLCANVLGGNVTLSNIETPMIYKSDAIIVFFENITLFSFYSILLWMYNVIASYGANIFFLMKFTDGEI